MEHNGELGEEIINMINTLNYILYLIFILLLSYNNCILFLLGNQNKECSDSNCWWSQLSNIRFNCSRKLIWNTTR